MVLVTVMIFTSVLFIAISSYFSVVLTDAKLVLSMRNAARAWTLADAGIEEAAWQINYNQSAFPAAQGWTGTTVKTKTASTFTDATGTNIGGYTVSVSNWNGSNPVASVTSSLASAAGADTQATVRARFVSQGLFQMAVQSQNRITLSGNAYTDSFNSATGPYTEASALNNGSVATNSTSTGAITLSGNAEIRGDANTGSGGTVSKSGNSDVTGGTSHNAANAFTTVTVPSSVTSVTSSGRITSTTTLTGGVYKYSDISLSGNNRLTITGNTTIYLTGTGTSSLSTSGNAQITLASGATLTIYADKNISISGNGFVNNNSTQGSKNLQIYGTSTVSSVSMSGNGAFIGVIDAPSANVSVTGNGEIYGAVIANQYTSSGNGGLHYDENLKNNGPSNGIKLQWYRKV